MSFLKKIFPFLFKSAPSPATTKPTSKSGSSTRTGTSSRSPRTEEGDDRPIVIAAYGIVARVRNARGLRKGAKVYVRAILEDGDRLRVRGTAPNGKKVTLTVPRRSLQEYQSEGVPEHVAKHYDKHSLFKEEHEAKMKAEALGKH
jgi:hypothetical protein